MYLTQPIRVSIHIVEFNRRFGLLHVGVSFENDYKLLRYDFKPGTDDYITFSKIKYIRWPQNTYRTKYIPETLDILRSSYITNTETRNVIIDWGVTNYTFREIEEYEKQLHDKYRLCIYDCRHYVRRFTAWATGYPTPVWKLNRLWKNSILK